jgi:hypothetical protein
MTASSLMPTNNGFSFINTATATGSIGSTYTSISVSPQNTAINLQNNSAQTITINIAGTIFTVPPGVTFNQTVILTLGQSVVISGPNGNYPAGSVYGSIHAFSLITPTPTTTPSPTPSPTPTITPKPDGIPTINSNNSDTVNLYNSSPVRGKSYVGQKFANNDVSGGVFQVRYDITDDAFIDVNANINVPGIKGACVLSLDGFSTITIYFDENNPLNLFQIPFQAGGYVKIRAPEFGTANIPLGAVNGQVKVGKGRLYDTTQINYPVSPGQVRDGMYVGKNNGLDPTLVYDPEIKRNKSMQSTCFVTANKITKIGNRYLTTAASFYGFDGEVHDPTLQKLGDSAWNPWMHKQ